MKNTFVRRIIGFGMIFILMLNLGGLKSYGGSSKFYIEYDKQVYLYKSKFVTIEIDGKEVKTGDMPAIILNDRTLVPVREVFESDSVGAKVDWNGDKQEIYISYDDKFITLQIDNQTARINNEEVKMDVPAKLIKDVSKNNAKTMIPLRFALEALEYDVEWDAKNYKAILKSPTRTIPGTEEGTETTEEQVSEDEISSEEQLEVLESNEAKRSLPTPLKDNPVIWEATEEQMEGIETLGTEAVISVENHPVVEIESIEYNEQSGLQQFEIEASGPISSLSKTMWEKKLIIDINNAMWDLPNNVTNYENNPLVESVRSSQYSLDPKVTRIVFDMKNIGNQYQISLSEDRTKVLLTAVSNVVHGIELGQNEKGDYVKITGTVAPDIKAFRLSNPDRIVLDLPNVQMILGYNSDEAEGQYITAIRSAQFSESTGRIVLETDGQADFKIIKKDAQTTMVQFGEPSYDNIKYENFDNPTIALAKASDMTLDLTKITYEDRYFENKYIITLPGDYSEVFGNGDVKINDGLIEAVDIGEDSKGNTQFTIKENGIFAFKIMEDDDNIYIKAFKPKEVYSQIIVVDAGHGDTDPGAMANGLYEKDVNLDIVLYMKEYFDQDPSVKVYYTRLEDTYPTLQDRAELANMVEADFFFSVHNNAYFSEHNGTETLYFPGSNTPGLNSFELADIVQDTLIAELGMKNRGTKARDNLYVLKHTNMPAIIAEIAFLTNTEDAKKLKDEAFKQKVGKTLYQSIVKTFDKFPTGR